MPPDESNRAFAIEVVARLKEAGFQALWAGGCVRDFLLGRTPKDYDVATDARPEAVRQLFGKRKTRAVGASFGVILVLGSKQADDVEVATFRTEGPYADGRRPDHVVFCSPEDDAQRRDFTINGMFYDPVEQRVLDFVGGEQDLKAGILRAIGDPHDRMREDKLRLLRAVRFTATMDLELDRTTADAVREMADDIHVVSAERITQELRRMLLDEHRARAMRLANETGLLPRIFPELEPLLDDSAADDPSGVWEQTLQMLRLLNEPGFVLAMATLLSGIGRDGHDRSDETVDVVSSLCRRLRLSNQEADDIGWLIERKDALVDAKRLSLARLKRLFAHPLAPDLVALNRVERLAENADLDSVAFCEEYLRNTPAEEINPVPLLTGDDLVASGLSPGRQFKSLLEAARDAQLNNTISTTDEALELVTRMVSGP